MKENPELLASRQISLFEKKLSQMISDLQEIEITEETLGKYDKYDDIRVYHMLVGDLLHQASREFNRWVGVYDVTLMDDIKLA